MSKSLGRSRFRFSLRSLALLCGLIGVLCAVTLTQQERRLLHQFTPEEGGGAMYATSFGWPFAYLRVPVDDYAHVPPDLFVPGLFADLALVAVCVAVVWLAARLASRRRQPHLQ